MSAINDGGPAFPFEGTYRRHEGLSLRDWFAGQAMAGLVGLESFGESDSSIRAGAAWSYDFADAMLEARKEGGL